jgi:TonB family protein
MKFCNRRTITGALSLAGVLIASVAHPQDRNADWLRRPSLQDLMGVLPLKAMKAGIGGRVIMACIVTVQGTLRDCQVESEKPAGAGFGEAALALTPQFALRPAMRGGVAVESSVRIPINWSAPDKELGSLISPNTSGPVFKSDMVYARMPYRSAPTYGEVLAAYPAKARAKKVSGVATLTCTIGKDGRLGGCLKIREEPEGYGFAPAARTLAPRFMVPTQDNEGRDTAGARTIVLVSFAAETLDDQGSLVGQPHWTALPSIGDLAAVVPVKARRLGALQARVMIRCKVGEGGVLEGCEAVSQEPEGLGYDEAALALSKDFRLAIWTEEGLPSVGATVQVPIRFDIKAAP